MQTIDQLIRDREGDTRVGLAFSDRTWTHAEVVRAQAERAALLLSLRQPGPFHVALLMDNVPEYVFWMGGAALAGAVVVGGNPMPGMGHAAGGGVGRGGFGATAGSGSGGSGGE